jgi:hypothetical protein
VDPTGLAPAVYTGVVTLTSDQAGQAQIPVALNVWNAGACVIREPGCRLADCLSLFRARC